MGGLIRGLSSMIGWSCFASMIALAIIAGYGWSQGYLAPERVQTMLAVARGTEMISKHDAERMSKQTASADRPSLVAIDMQRAAMSGELEMRENIVRDMYNEFKKLQRALEEEKERFNTYADSFKKSLSAERDKAITDGQRQFQAIVDSMKPRQAKEQLLIKFKEDKVDIVVNTLRNMDEVKRAKVLAEFKASEDQETLAKILEFIRSPKVEKYDQALKSLEAPAGS